MTAQHRQELVADNIGKPLDTLIKEAHANQEQLRQIGAALEDSHNVEFTEAPYELSDKGVKTRESILRKVKTEGYSSPGQLADISRATFVVDSPDDAHAVTHALAQHGTVYDKGWVKLAQTGYLDRKVYMKFENGGVAEIQIVPRGVHQLKSGIGHRLYDISRDPSYDHAARRAAMRKARRLYSHTLEYSAFHQISAVR
jgi:hypothetical protein